MATASIQRCLVCNCTKTDATLLDISSKTSIPDLLERELTVIMFLRKSLGLSKTFLVSILQNAGESPSFWDIKLCRVCYRVFEEVKFVWSRLKVLEKEFENLSNVLKSKLNENSNSVCSESYEERLQTRKIRGNPGKVSEYSKDISKDAGASISGRIRKELTHRLNDNKPADNIKINSHVQSGLASLQSKQTKVTTSLIHRPTALIVKMEPEIAHSKNLSNTNLTAENSGGSSNLLEEEETDKQIEFEDIEQLYDNDDDDLDIDQEVALDNSDNNNRITGISKRTARTHSQRQRIWRFARREKGTILQGVPRDDKFVCPRCEKKFLSLSICDDHILNYHYNGKWPTTVSCHICDLKFKRENWLRMHMKMRHPDAKLPSDELVEERYEISYPVVALDGTNEAIEVDTQNQQTSANEVHKDLLILPLLQRSGNILEISLPETFFRLPEEVKAKLVRASEEQQCDLCNEKFPTVLQYESHLQGTHQGNKNSYGCPMCKRKYEEIQDLIMHLEGNHVSDKLSCPKCGRNFKEEIYLNAHVQRVHFGIECPYKCIKCGIGHIRRANLNNHLKSVHKLQIASSSFPDRPEVAKRITVKKSMNKRIGIQKYLPCETCLNDINSVSIKFASQEELDAHVKRKHMGISKPYQCAVCPKEYTRPYLLKTHMKTHTVRNDERPPEKKPKSVGGLSCNPCGKHFKTKGALQTHRRSRFHENVRPFVCEICSQSFTGLFALQNHQAHKHHEELKIDPFKCTYCDKVLNSARSLTNHIKVHHSKNAKYKCPYCNVQSQYESAMKLHINVRHTKTSKHLCPHCPKTFSNPQYLNNHLRTHTGEKPHECKFCLRKFADKPTYNRHVESHSGIEHICPHCPKGGFKTRHALGVHIKTHQGIKRMKTINQEHTVESINVGTNQSFEAEFETSEQKPALLVDVDTVNSLDGVTPTSQDQLPGAVPNMPDFDFK